MIFNKLSKLKMKSKIFYLCIVLIVITATLLLFIIIPNINEIRLIKEDIITQKKNYEIKKIQNENIDTIIEKVNYVDSKMDDLDSIFIKKNNELEFITLLENLALKNNISQKIDFTPSENITNEVEKIPVKLNVSGSYNSFLSYLSNLETARYYISIENISITGKPSNTEQNSSSVIQANITANTYWQ